MLSNWGEIKRRAEDKGEVGEKEICEPENRFNKSKGRKVDSFCLLYSCRHLTPLIIQFLMLLLFSREEREVTSVPWNCC